MTQLKGRPLRYSRFASARGFFATLLFLVVPFAASANNGAALMEKNGCTSCHGDKGQGVEGLAPPLRNNAFVKSASADDVKETILKGRRAKARKHPQFATGMPPNPVPENEIDQLVAYVKGDLQK